MAADDESPWFFLLTHVFVVALASLQLALCFQPEWGGGFSLSDFASVQFFNFHPLLNILAFGVAMTESLIGFRGFGLARSHAKTLHALLQLVSLLLGILAFVVVVFFHNTNKYPNLYSVHSWIGISVYFLSWTQFIAGFFIFWLPRLAPLSLKAAFLRYHKIGGLATYFGAMAAIATGLMQKQSFLRNHNPKAHLFGKANLLANTIAVLAVFTSLGILGALGFGRLGGARSSRVGADSAVASRLVAPASVADSSVTSKRPRTRTPSRTIVL